MVCHSLLCMDDSRSRDSTFVPSCLAVFVGKEWWVRRRSQPGGCNSYGSHYGYEVATKIITRLGPPQHELDESVRKVANRRFKASRLKHTKPLGGQSPPFSPHVFPYGGGK